MRQKQTAIVWDERFLAHDPGKYHPESPQRLLAIKEVLDLHKNFDLIAPRMATMDEIQSVHTQNLIADVEASKGHYTEFDADTKASPCSRDAAFLAVGGLVEAIKAVEAGQNKNAFVFPRPPGHHAETNRAMGFCLFNNIAIGAEYLLRQHSKKKIAIVDFDVHHGNGTQHIFYKRNDVLYISTHQYPFYPGTGSEQEKGEGEGLGYTLNIPLNAGLGDESYAKAFDEKIIPALKNYNPDFILVSAGFDAHYRDPLASMKVSKKGFSQMTEKLQKLSQNTCQGKLVFVLEGGYDLKGLQEGVEAVFENI